MKHRLGNSPMCWSCRFYTEEIDEYEKLRGDNAGWCICREHLAIGINGRKRKNPPAHEQKPSNGTACKHWIDAESGFTIFEVLTGYKEPYDGSKVNFYEEQQRIF